MKGIHNSQAPVTTRNVTAIKAGPKHARAGGETEQAARARYADLFDSVPVGHATFDNFGRILRINLAGAVLLGGDQLQWAHAPLAPLLTAAEHRKFLAHFAQCRRSAGAVSTELALRTRDGRHITVLLTSTRHPTANKFNLEFETALIDITERKRNEESLLRAKHEWERTFDSVPDLIAIIDTQHRIRRVNRAMAERLGTTPEQCVGKLCYRCVHGTTAPPPFCPHAGTIRDGLEHTVEVALPELSGEFIVTTSPLRDERNVLIGSVHIARDVTARNKSEQALRENEARFQRLATHLEDVLYSVDAVTGEFRYVSPALTRLLGYTLADVQRMGGRRKFLARVIQDRKFAEQDRVFRQLQKGCLNPAGQRSESRWRCKDGTLKCITDHWIAVYEGKRLLSTEGVLVDITARKQAEQAVCESERLLREVIDLLPVHIFAKDQAGRFLFVNRAAAEACGRRPDEMIGQRQMDLWKNKRHAKAFLRDDQQVLASGKPKFVAEEPIVNPDGQLRFLQATKVPFTPPGTTQQAVLGVAVDITERKQAQAERDRLILKLKETAAESHRLWAQLEAVFQAMQDGVVVFDAAGKVLLVNPAEARINGFASSAAMQRDLAFFAKTYELFQLDGRPLPVKHWPASRVLRGETLENVELRGRRTDTGREWFFSFSGAPVRDEQGRIVLAVILTRDISERQRLQGEVLRTAENERQRLGHDLHDGLGQTLAAVSLLTDAVRHALAAEGHTAAAEIERINDRVRRALNQAHSLAKTLFPTSLHVSGLQVALEELAANVQELFGIPCQCQPDHVRLRNSDLSAQLYRIAQEAAHNAAKHSGCQRIEIALAQSHREIILTVRDNGVGIRERPASGLGLRIMHYRAGLIGARLSIVGVPGQGTTVTCRVSKPARTASVPNTECQHENPNQIATSRPRTDRRRARQTPRVHHR